ncbi:hypothetical protein IC582_002108 [Cucumis melo]|uniref:GPI transamidase component PIG-T n=1 Tax=Cucumis melo TaxID=3656 RepID=A0A1S3C6Z6_CUCME|nr:uncharacterized protein LOC103497563 [Cucumis melo]
MASFLRLISLLCLPILFAVSVIGSVSEGAEEDFSEDLLLKPLPDRKVLAHFHFQSTAPSSRSNSYGRHHHLFPKAISQLVHKYRIKEMELSFTQGRWRYDRWGGFDSISSSNAKPSGVELWAVFDVPPNEVDATWKNLTHSLSGLFCASINFLESSTSYSAPKWSFHPASENMRYGTLPREAVCTENLTPWLKLLPCRDKSGLSVLMDRPSIYKGYYHSQRLHLLSSEFDSDGVDSAIVLDQTLTVVLQPHSHRGTLGYSSATQLQPSWSLSSIFGRRVIGKCSLARSSNVYIQLDRGLMAELQGILGEQEKFAIARASSEGSISNPAFELSANPDRVHMEMSNGYDKHISVLYMFMVAAKYDDSEPLDLRFTWKIPIAWSIPQAPLYVTRFLLGSGNERGVIALQLKSTKPRDQLMPDTVFADSCSLLVRVFQVVPWYIKVYYHTLQVFIDDQRHIITNVVEKMQVSPSKDKVSPGVMEMLLKFPCGLKSAALTIEFDKGFLHIDEYPPDANQGLDIPSAVISFPDFFTSTQFVEKNSSKSPILLKWQGKNPILSYTEVLLVPFTTPDFSMPYNVITITCTVLALYFGSLLNVLRRRVGEEERFMKSKATRKLRVSHLVSKLLAKLRGRQWEPSESQSHSSVSNSKSKLLFKVILVAGLAAAWQYYFG